MVRRKCLQVEGTRENRETLWEKGRSLAIGLRASGSWEKSYGGRVTTVPTYLAAMLTTALCSLFAHPDHDEDLRHLPGDRPPGLQ